MNIRDCFKPINNRINGTPVPGQNSFMRALSIVAPVFIYYFLSIFITYGAAIIIGTGQYEARTSQFFVNHSVLCACIIRIASVILAVVPLVISFKGECPIILQKDDRAKRHLLLIVVASIAMAMFYNMLFSYIGFSASSDSFKATEARQMALPLWAGILVYGIVTPVTEEIVYRGIVYNRIRRYFNLPMAIIAGSFIFGIAHGNRVQLVYGFLMGILISYIYERCGSFIYPVLFHCVANTAVYVVMANDSVRSAVCNVAVMIICGVVGIAAMIAVMLERRPESIE